MYHTKTGCIGYFAVQVNASNFFQFLAKCIFVTSTVLNKSVQRHWANNSREKHHLPKCTKTVASFSKYSEKCLKQAPKRSAKKLLALDTGDCLIQVSLYWKLLSGM